MSILTIQTLGLIRDALGPFFSTVIAILILWSLIWKGFALWKAAQAKSKPWFIIFMIFNTLGILEIIYIFFVKTKTEQSTENKEEIKE